MAIKLTLLKSGELLISDAKELVQEDEQLEPYAYLLNRPHVVITSHRQEDTEQIDVIFRPWIVISKDSNVVVPTDWVVPIVEPLDSIREMYVEKQKTFPKEETLDFKENKKDGD